MHVNARFRLTKSTDFKRVRRIGKSYAHPFILLIAQPNYSEHSRIAVSAGRSVGKAVQRNRAKRLIRAAIQSMLGSIKPGWDIVLLARHPMASASFQETCQALNNLFERANIIKLNDDN
jgi:ribonuclease P protein component